ncbi:GHKL domain-containing protein [Streptococcus hyovaginalis]
MPVEFQELLLIILVWELCWLIFSHISNITLPLKYLLPASAVIVATMFFGSFYVYPLYPLFFLGLCYYHNLKGNVIKYLFYSLFPIVTVDIFSNSIILLILEPLLNINIENLSRDYILLYISYGGVFSLYYFLNKVLDLNFKHIDEAATVNQMKWLNVLMLSYYLLFNLGYVNQTIKLEIMERPQTILLYFFFYIWLLSDINYQSKLEMDSRLEQAKREKINAVEEYNHQIELLYEDLALFKENYDSTLETLRNLIDQEDVEGIKEVYGQIISDNAPRINQSQYELGRLANLQVSAIKSILSTKMIEAQSQGVEAFLEIPDRIDHIYLEPLDLVIVLSIFLDNAIEAAQEADRPLVSVAFFERDQSQLLIIENSISKNSVDISKIFHEGYSTKGTGRGIGLSNVRRILEGYPNTTLSTKTAHRSFTQILEMRQE